MATKDLVFRLLGKDDSASSSLDNLAKKGETVSTKFKNVFLGVGVAAAGVGLAAAGAVAAIVKTGIGEAMDASAGMAQLQAGIKSTGGVAGVTVGHMEDLASSIQGMSGQTDDSIVSTEKLLLTFTNIRNKGPDKIFDLATKSAADMAAKMGGDASKYAVQLGKALNDPIKGVTALSKVGVSFTESQKAQIAAMQKAGNVAGAQKIILGELSKEFGGAAKAAGQSLPGQLERMKRAFEDVSQAVVEKLLPVIRPAFEGIITAIQAVGPVLVSFAGGFAKALTGMLGNMTAVKGGISDFLDAFSAAPGSVDAATARMAGGFAGFGATVRTVFEGAKTWFGQMGAAIAPLIPAFVQMVTAFSPLRIAFQALAPVLPVIALALAQLGSALGQGLAGAVTALAPGITLIVNGLVTLLVPLLRMPALIQGVVIGFIAWRAVSLGMAAVQAVMLGITAATYGAAGANLVAGTSAKVYAIATTAMSVASKIAAAAQWVFNAAMSANPIGIVVVAIAALVAGLVWFFTQTKAGQAVWAGFTAALANGWRQLVAGFNVVVGVLATGWNQVVGFVRTAVGNVLGFLRTWGPGILAVIAPVIGIPILIAQHWNEIVAVARRVWAAVTGAVNAGISAVRGVVTAVVSWVVGYWRTGWNNLTAVVRVVWGAIVAVVRGYIAVVRAVVTAVVTGVVTLWRTGWNNLTTVVRTVWNAIVGVISPAISRIRAAVTAGVNGVRAVWTSVWNAVSAAVRTVWNAISATVSAAISRVRSYVTTGVNAVRSAWQTGMNAVRSVVTTVWNAIASFVSSSISRVRSYVATGVNTIRSVWQAGMNAVRTVVTTVWNAIASFISTVIGRVRSIVTSGISTVRSVVSTGLNAVLSMFRSIWNTVVSTISSAVGRAVSVVRSMGSQILSAVTSIASRMFSAGAAIVNGLANGIRSAVGAATSAIKGVISAVTNFLPHSPAKEGPLSGRGWTPYSGAALTRGLAEGMNSEVGTVRAAGLNVATAASITPTLGLASRRPAPAAAGPAALAGRAPWQAPAGNGPLVAIENFHAHGQSPDDVAAALAWQLRVPF